MTRNLRGAISCRSNGRHAVPSWGMAVDRRLIELSHSNHSIVTAAMVEKSATRTEPVEPVGQAGHLGTRGAGHLAPRGDTSFVGDEGARGLGMAGRRRRAVRRDRRGVAGPRGLRHRSGRIPHPARPTPPAALARTAHHLAVDEGRHRAPRRRTDMHRDTRHHRHGTRRSAAHSSSQRSTAAYVCGSQSVPTPESRSIEELGG